MSKKNTTVLMGNKKLTVQRNTKWFVKYEKQFSLPCKLKKMSIKFNY